MEQSGRVLVVNDDAAILRSLGRGLRLNGYAVSLAGDGESALAQLEASRADVIVLDVSMPAMNGTEVCRRLRAAGDDVPVLMLSALDEVTDRVAGLQAGADDTIGRSIGPSQIRSPPDPPSPVHPLARRTPQGPESVVSSLSAARS
jgi:two-component system, OmpR family, response regulator PrrA